MIEVERVRLHDGTPAYRLPGGTVVTEEAWRDIEPRFLAEVIERDAAGTLGG